MKYPDDVPSASWGVSVLLSVSAVGFAFDGALHSSNISLLTASVLALIAILSAMVGAYVDLYVMEGTA